MMSADLRGPILISLISFVWNHFLSSKCELYQTFVGWNFMVESRGVNELVAID
jgi:hypothetical protein